MDDDYGDPPWYANEPWAGFKSTELELPDGISTPATEDISDVLSKAFINDHARPISGDCPAIAGALARVFDADALIWLVNEPGDLWPIHALVRKGDVVSDGLRVRDTAFMEDYIHRCVDEDAVLEDHYEERDPESFEILDETAIAQSAIDDRLVPAIRGTKDWSDENPD